jgi:hypothetical protein
MAQNELPKQGVLMLLPRPIQLQFIFDIFWEILLVN